MAARTLPCTAATSPRAAHSPASSAPAPAAPRRAALALLATALLPLPSQAAEAEAEAGDWDAEELAGKATKVGGALLLADVVSAAVLGKSLSSLGKPAAAGSPVAAGEPGKRDWKEAAADMLLAKLSPSVMPPLTPAAAALLARVAAPSTTPVLFAEVLAAINASYTFEPTAFTAGRGTVHESVNAAGTNEGAARVLAFARLADLSDAAAAALFCEHLVSVQQDPNGTAHANIRGLLAGGLRSVDFERFPLAAR